MSRRTRYIIIAAIITLVVMAGIFAVTPPPSPDGRYVTTAPFAITGDLYYEFSGGKVYFLYFDNSGATNRQYAGMTYFQKPDGWYLSTTIVAPLHGTLVTNTATAKIQCAWSGLTLTYDTGETEFWRRRLLPGKRPEWMTLYLPWSVQ